MTVRSGKVISFKMSGPSRGYGFISPDEPDEPNIYFNNSATRYSPVKRGDRVNYRIATNSANMAHRGPRAHKIVREGDEI